MKEAFPLRRATLPCYAPSDQRSTLSNDEEAPGVRKTVSAILLLLAILSLSSCSDPSPIGTLDETGAPSIVHFDFGQPVGMTRARYADYLKQRATELAESDMARLSAVELVYRDKMYYYGYQNSVATISHGAYAKMYRQFTGYEVLDITHSDSMFHPILFTIEFSCDILVTEPVFVERESRKEAQNAYTNKNYSFQRSHKVRRTYSCDEKGLPQQPFPPPLERPNYWDTGTPTKFDLFNMKEVTGIPNAAR